MQDPSDARANAKDWALDRVFRGLISCLKALPYERRLKTIDALMRRVIGPAAGFDARARSHLALVFPQMPTEARDTLAQRAIGNTGRTLIELYSGAAFSRRMARMPLHGEGLDVIEQARNNGTPVIFVTGHFGNHEAPRHALIARGFDIGGLYRPMSNPYFNEHYARTMTDFGGPVFAQGPAGTMGFVRHLKRGGMATLLFDVWAAEGEQIEFMGLPADTSLSAGELCQRTGALMVPYFGIRQPDGHSFAIEVEAPIPEGSPLAMMQAATARLEARIRANPEQYFWVHRRWKPLH